MGTGADREAAGRLEGSYAGDGYALRYPAGWRADGGGSLTLTGPSGGSCVVAPAGPLPDWTSSELRVAYVLREAEELGRRAGLAPATAGIVRGANVEGAGAVAALRTDGRRRRTRNAVLASAGSGVAVSCVASERRFEELDEEVFRPVIASVRVRRDQRLEPVQAEVASMEGIRGASLTSEGRLVRLSIDLRRRPRALFVTRAAMRETVQALRGRDARVTATLDGETVVRGGYEFDRRRGEVRVAVR